MGSPTSSVSSERFKRAVGVDVGVGIPAWSCIDREPRGFYRYVAHEVLRTKKSETYFAKRRRIAEHFGQFLLLHKPDIVVVEDQTQTQNAIRMGKGSEQAFVGFNSNKTVIVQGMLVDRALALGFNVIEREPRTSKIALLGRGNRSADKKTVQAGVERLLGVHLPQDAADATAHAILGLQMPLHEVWPLTGRDQ
jgi:Holliday junction resolvasome RuvABC endonuclease subunit